MIESGFYATENGEMLVVFGGRIILDGFAGVNPETGKMERVLAMFEGDKEYEIGEDISRVSAPDLNSFHPVRFLFQDDKSIDALISQLQEIKELGKEK